jgi:acetoin utilization deacetylase AcuC-like enzyme
MHDLVIFTNEAMTKHNLGLDHPECGARLERILDMVKNDLPDIPIEKAYPANEDTLLLAHPQSHLDSILDNTPFDGYHAIDGDTYLSPSSYDAALISVGASVQAVKAVMDGKTKTAFALSRPPGHHAEYDTAMGFCLFANAFIAARSSGARTLIIDFDVHHGNGTEDLVKRRTAHGHDDIAYASIHQGFGFWPNTGHVDAKNICNTPLNEGSTSDDFRQTITDKIVPFAKLFDPELIIFSAGFDGHERDPLGELNMIHDDFKWIVETVRPICTHIVSILEGGYNLDTLPISVRHHLQALQNTEQ